MEPVTRKEMFLAKAAGQDVSLPEPCTREEIFLKKIAERGTSSDWNAKEGEAGHVLNRTHYRESVELINGTLGDIGEGILGMASDVEFVAGETYTITYNGADYVCTAFEFATEEITSAVVGNGSPLGLDDTGEPFSMYGMDGMLICVDLSGATEAQVKITGYRYITLPRKYLPKGYCTIDITDEEKTYVSGDEQVKMSMDATELVNAITHGLPIHVLNGLYTYVVYSWLMSMDINAWVAGGGNFADWPITLFASEPLNKTCTVYINVGD